MKFINKIFQKYKTNPKTKISIQKIPRISVFIPHQSAKLVCEASNLQKMKNNTTEN